MSFAENFDIGYLKIFANQGEDLFLSVTKSMREGPGIQRDGISPPRMIDPHNVRFVRAEAKIAEPIIQLPKTTTDPYVQRAGTWTLFEHIKYFVDKYGEEYRVIGVQSYGDLTMNLWHVAFVWEDGRPILYHLAAPPVIKENLENYEPIEERIYRCLVKWKPNTEKNYMYEFLDLRFSKTGIGYMAENIITDSTGKQVGTDISNEIDFAFSGKVIVNKGSDISLSSAIDQFQDVRHIFSLPGANLVDNDGNIRERINFGEFVLFKDLNARRGALGYPIIIDLSIPNRDSSVVYSDLRDTLINRYSYVESRDSPTRRGEFRKYSENSVELFFRHNVYPFGVLGGRQGNLCCLSSGGLSGRVGNTLEGIIRIMFDFFGSEDALVLDEGYDTFHIINPNDKKKQDEPDCYKYDNDQILGQIAKFTLWRMAEDQIEFEAEERKKPSEKQYPLGPDMWQWPLNIERKRIIDNYKTLKTFNPEPASGLDVMTVAPRRSQMRAVLIFAKRRDFKPLDNESKNSAPSSLKKKKTA